MMTWSSRSQISLLFALILLIILWLLAPSGKQGSPSRQSHLKHAFRQRLIAVGDLHGDISNAKKVLRMAEIIDEQGKWNAGTDILVQTGDIVDRGTYARDIYLLMRELRGQAESVGGRVISTLGNHEIMNAIGDWRYVTQEDIKRFSATETRQKEMSIDGWLGQEWLANYSSTALVALSPFASAPLLSFTHGSLRPSYPNLLPYPEAINELGRSLLQKALTPPLPLPYPPNPYPGLPKTATREEMELYSEGGPFWWRGLAEMQDEKTVCGWAAELRKKLGVKRVIGGHTPNFERIVDRCNASIIIIDTGISSAYGGVLSALEIIYTLSPIKSPDHKQDPLLSDAKARFLEREEVHAVYERRKKIIAIEEQEVLL